MSRCSLQLLHFLHQPAIGMPLGMPVLFRTTPAVAWRLPGNSVTAAWNASGVCVSRSSISAPPVAVALCGQPAHVFCVCVVVVVVDTFLHYDDRPLFDGPPRTAAPFPSPGPPGPPPGHVEAVGEQHGLDARCGSRPDRGPGRRVPAGVAAAGAAAATGRWTLGGFQLLAQQPRLGLGGDRLGLPVGAGNLLKGGEP